MNTVFLVSSKSDIFFCLSMVGAGTVKTKWMRKHECEHKMRFTTHLSVQNTFTRINEQSKIEWFENVRKARTPLSQKRKSVRASASNRAGLSCSDSSVCHVTFGFDGRITFNLIWCIASDLPTINEPVIPYFSQLTNG